jgi:hypothetical protein
MRSVTAVCWLAALGLTCLASSAVLRRRPEPSGLLDRLGRCTDDLQLRVYA